MAAAERRGGVWAPPPPAAAAGLTCVLNPSSLPSCSPFLPRLQAIRDHSQIVMGKNTMMRRSIRLYCERTGNDQWLCLLDHMIGNVGIIFTKGDLNEVHPQLDGG